jgi:L-iditol 2-dehydrogenase
MGYPNVCPNPFPSLGYKVNGGFEELFAVPENIFRLGFVNRIPESLSFMQASLSEVIACCINAQRNVGVKKGDTVLVLGSGPAGIIHTQLARLAGASKVILSQRSRSRLELATSRFPVDRAVASSQEDLGEAVRAETGGEGADVVFVCAPSAEAQETALRLAAPRGRVNLFGGLPKGESIIHVDANVVHYKELFISGASSSLPDGNREALRLLADRAIDPDKLITHVFKFEEIVAAFDVAESKTGIKVVVTL